MTTAAIEETAERVENTRPKTKPLTMVRMELDQQQMARWMGAQGLQDEDMAAHHLLTQCLGDLRPTVFRPLPAEGGRKLNILGYCRSSGDELEQAVQLLACPLQRSVIPEGSIKTKEMPTGWSEDAVQGFEIRTRPIVRISRKPDRVHPAIAALREQPGFRPGDECDVYRWRWTIAQADQETPPDRETACAEWLGLRAEKRGGCRIDPAEVVLSKFRRTKAVRKTGTPGILGPDAVLRGLLHITEPEQFEDLLEHGLGRHRAYGYGMILLRPALPLRR